MKSYFAGTPPLRFSGSGTPDEILQRYLDSLTHQLTAGGLNVDRQQVGPLMSTVATGLPENEMVLTEICVCVAPVDMVTPGMVTGYTRDVMLHLQSLEWGAFGDWAMSGGSGMGLGPSSAPGAIAALVTHNVDPAAIGHLQIRLSAKGRVTLPVIIDLRLRAVHIAPNRFSLPKPSAKEVTLRAMGYLPHPVAVFG